MTVSSTPFESSGALSRFSSRQGKLSHVYLRDRLKDAKSYDRIAGYFRSSIFELVGEEIEAIDEVRIVANADLDIRDVKTAQKVREANLFQRFVEGDTIAEAALHPDRFGKLYELLKSGRVKIKIVAKNVAPFLHGKAGVIKHADGRATAFMGSINETRSAWAHNYELLWEDTSADGVTWVQDEFDDLWNQGEWLPDVIIEEVGRLAKRYEVRVADLKPDEVAPAALVESPLYRDGEALQPWQRAFVGIFLEHRDTYGRARILLADEVGVGKTLSLAASALVSVLLGDGPVLILVPATITEQWQIELKDRLGIPSGRWHSSKKVWIDANGREIKTSGVQDVARCPFAIGFVSTGLIVHGVDEHGRPKEGSEAEALSRTRFGMVILDEAHKARGSQPMGKSTRESNNLLKFMELMADRSRHLLLSTATPIQTHVDDLWDLLLVLNRNGEFVLGNWASRWRKSENVVPIITGQQRITSLREGWDLLVNPIPPAGNDALIANLRSEFRLGHDNWTIDKLAASIETPGLRDLVESEITEVRRGQGYFQRSNPLIRHIVLRKRRDLEDQGLLQKLPVTSHPIAGQALPTHLFDGTSIITSEAFNAAYKAAEDFTAAYRKRQKAAGFMRTLLLQRICSSHAAGISTAEALLGKRELDEEMQDELDMGQLDIVEQERVHLQALIDSLTGATDPKLEAVRYFLDEHHSATGTWRDMGCIIFSQYYDTALWTAESLSREYPDQPIAVYAGAGKSKIIRAGASTSFERDEIKKMIRHREITLVAATDAACEGLNLQTLGTLINVDLPWNPSRLEQRIGRIKRFGQTRSGVDMANLTYAGTIDEKVYRVLSERLQVTHDIFGSLPETIDDEWISNAEDLEKRLREYTNPRERADPFKVAYGNPLLQDDSRWQEAQAVLARRDLEEILSRGWAVRTKAA